MSNVIQVIQPAGQLDTLTGNAGGTVGPTGGNINLIGINGTVVTGDPFSSTLYIDGDAGGIAAVDSGDNITVNTVANVATVNLNKSILQPVTNAAGTEGLYSLGGDRFLHNYGTDNTFLGSLAGNLTLVGASNNVAIGGSAGSALEDGFNNVFLGFESGSSNTDGETNIFLGLQSGLLNTVGNENLAIGTLALSGSAVSNKNLVIGNSSGINYLTTEANNVLISSEGVTGDANVLRIGTDGTGDYEVDSSYVAGIYARTVDAMTQQVVIIDSTGKLGSIVGGGGDITDVNSGDNITVNTVGTVATVNLNKSIAQPVTNAAGTEGLYSLGGNRFLHNYGIENTFLGQSAGNLTLAPGAFSNVAIGTAAGSAISGSSKNTLVGAGSGQLLENGIENSLYGFMAGNALVNSNANCFFGSRVAPIAEPAYNNTFIGSYSANLFESGDSNVAVGRSSLGNALYSEFCIIIGDSAGSGYVNAESNNILIGNAGVAAENSVIRIGTQGTGDGEQDTTYIAGIYGSSVGATNGVALVDSVGKLGSSNGTDGQVLIGGGTAPVWSNITSTDGSVTVTNGVNTIDLSVDGSVIGGCHVFTGVGINGQTAPTYYDCAISVLTNPGDAPLVVFTNPVVSPTVFHANVFWAWSSATTTTTGSLAFQYSGGSSGASSFVQYNLPPIGGSSGYVSLTNANSIQFTATQGASGVATNYVGSIQIVQF